MSTHEVITLPMPESAADELERQIEQVRQAWGKSTTVETVLAVVADKALLVVDTAEPADAGDAPEPMQERVLLVKGSEAKVFGQNIKTLMDAWGTAAVTDTVRRAIEQATTKLEDTK